MIEDLPAEESPPILAIDPGKKGGLVWGDGSPEMTKAAKMPQTPHDLRDVLDEITSELGATPTVYMEKVGGFISGSRLPGSSMFNFGRNVGILEGVIACANMRLILVTPLNWQRALALGKKGGKTNTEWKNKLKGAAQNLFPTHHITLDTSDAFLIYYAATRELI